MYKLSDQAKEDIQSAIRKFTKEIHIALTIIEADGMKISFDFDMSKPEKFAEVNLTLTQVAKFNQVFNVSVSNV